MRAPGLGVALYVCRVVWAPFPRTIKKKMVSNDVERFFFRQVILFSLVLLRRPELLVDGRREPVQRRDRGRELAGGLLLLVLVFHLRRLSLGLNLSLLLLASLLEDRPGRWQLAGRFGQLGDVAERDLLLRRLLRGALSLDPLPLRALEVSERLA